ncbi:MAG: hypothetical protein GF421_02060 [Candidatus Aminicenantes bacterium]|nr:hypothetical protein [Candidatus Aminicenantes bacterium]
MHLVAFLLFHLKVGTRLALKKTVPVLGIMFAVYYIFKPELFHQLFSVLLREGSWIPGLLYTVICGATSMMAASRICLGLTGWMSHLPLSGRSMRRLSEIAVFTAQIPVLIVLMFFPVLSILRHEASSQTTAFLAGVLLIGYGAAKASVPSQRKYLSSPLGYMACLFLGSGRWGWFFFGMLVLFLVDMVSGPLSVSKKRTLFKSGGTLLNALIIWRAIKFRIFVPAVCALSVLGATQLFLTNNQTDPKLSLRVVIFGGALSLTLFLSLVSNLIVVRRPAWPWIRSLPWSAGHRILLDSLYLGLLALPLSAVLFFIEGKAFWHAALFLPAAVLWSSISIRKGGGFKTGAAGRIFCFGFISSLWISVIPVGSLLFLMGIPFLFKYAVECEKNLKVSTWLELHHLAAGDPLSWSQQ